MSRIRRKAVRESSDCLGMGLCYSTANGRVLLINKQMRILARKILGQEISNAHTFFSILSQGVPQRKIERLEYGSEIVLSFPDQAVWQFTTRDIFLGQRKIVLLEAVDLSTEHALRLQLEEKSAELRSMQERLKQYSQNLQEVTVMEEQLQTKNRIHRELGHVLLASRRNLAEGNGMDAGLLQQWKDTISLLKDLPSRQETNAVSIVQSAAHLLGVQLDISGEIPADKLTADILAEALNNAARHGHARTMQVISIMEENLLCLEITNDGTAIAGNIHEAGGLTGLRRRIESIGGSMEIEASPVRIKVRIPVRKGAENVSGFDCRG